MGAAGEEGLREDPTVRKRNEKGAVSFHSSFFVGRGRRFFNSGFASAQNDMGESLYQVPRAC